MQRQHNIVSHRFWKQNTSQSPSLNLAIAPCQILMQPPRNQFETYRGWSPAWLASWLPFDIVFPLLFPPSPSRPLPTFSFLPRRKLFTRRILVVAGWVWRLSTVDWPILAARQILLAVLTRPNISLYLSLFLSPPLALLPFFAPFSHRPHFFFDPEPSRHYFSVFSSFIVLMRSLCRHALYLTDAFLFFLSFSSIFVFCSLV